MSDLRQQLEQERAAYQAVRYPGNLANDLASRQRFRIGSFVKIAIPLAAAACIALVFIAHRTPSQPRVVVAPPSHFESPSATSATADVIPIAPALPITPTPEAVPSSLSFPTDLPTSPGTALTSFPSPPSMPSWSDTDSSTTTQKEPT